MSDSTTTTPSASSFASAALSGKKLGVLLATSPQNSNFEPVVALLNTALDEGVVVYLYCIDDGVRCAATPEFQKLKERGTKLFACAYGAHRRHIPVDDTAAFSGLTIVSDLIANTDKFLAFT
ncbi:MAG: DsrE family protein [Candidatus Methylacidiphilales bacterium]|nr:DsrE family protein [Candidatus Methylacidiphilales bacterium]